jgi:radical SAM superfamily enzyme YgiQ (UPF0313 family)
MTDILLTHSYFLRFDPKQYKIMMPYPPLGTLYAGSYLKQRGYDVAMFDSMLADKEEEIIPYIKKHRPRLVVIYDDGFNYLTKMCLSRMREAAFKMSEIAKEHGCQVIVFSSDATDHVESFLKHGADFVIIGEAEETLAELAELLLRDGRKDRQTINGIAYVKDGRTERTAKRGLIRDLDALPFPAWEITDIERYRDTWMKRHGYFSMNVVTTRGCPFHCNWCAKPLYGQIYHSRSPENVVAEFKVLRERYHPDHIWFCDDIFGLKPGWTTRFSELVVKENATIPFKCLSRVDLLLQEDNIRHLKNAGCQYVWAGAESGSQKILDAMEKGTTVEEIYRASELLHKNGIKVAFFLQFGYPGEKREDIEKTIKMLKDCLPDDIGISVSYPLPGTKFYENVKAKLGEKTNWVDSHDLALLFPGEYPEAFYRVLYQVVHRKYRIYRGMHALSELVKTPYKVDGARLRRLASMMLSLAVLPYHSLRLKRFEGVR